MRFNLTRVRQFIERLSSFRLRKRTERQDLGEQPASSDQHIRSACADDESGALNPRRESFNADAFEPTHVRGANPGGEIPTEQSSSDSEPITSTPSNPATENATASSRVKHAALPATAKAMQDKIKSLHIPGSVKELQSRVNTGQKPPYNGERLVKNHSHGQNKQVNSSTSENNSNNNYNNNNYSTSKPQASVLHCSVKAHSSEAVETVESHHGFSIGEELANVYDEANPLFDGAMLEERHLSLCNHAKAPSPVPMNQCTQAAGVVEDEIAAVQPVAEASLIDGSPVTSASATDEEQERPYPTGQSEDASRLRTSLTGSIMSESTWGPQVDLPTKGPVSMTAIGTSQLSKRYPDRQRGLGMPSRRGVRTSGGDYVRYRRSKPAPVDSRTWSERQAIRKRVEARARWYRREERQRAREALHPKYRRICDNWPPPKHFMKVTENGTFSVNQSGHPNYPDWMSLTGVQREKILIRRFFLRVSITVGLRGPPRLVPPYTSISGRRGECRGVYFDMARVRVIPKPNTSKRISQAQ